MACGLWLLHCLADTYWSQACIGIDIINLLVQVPLVLWREIQLL